jgi:TPR repeat protein
MNSSRTVRQRSVSEELSEALFTSGDFLEDIGEFRAAFQCFRAAAEAGQEVGQCRLGLMYSSGKGVRKDLKKAAYWYRKAFNNRTRINGLTSAAMNLAIDLKKSGDIRGAMRWFERARALEDGSACLELAKIYAARKTGRKKAESLLKEVLGSHSDNASEWDREEAQHLLEKLLGSAA